MTNLKPRAPSYRDRLLEELNDIHAALVKVLAASRIVNVDPNRSAGRRGVSYVGTARWGWGKSDGELEAARMALLRQVRDWEPRFRLLFPHPTPTVSERLDKSLGRITAWLIRENRAHGVPSTMAKAREMLDADVVGLRGLTDLLATDTFEYRLVVDTNTLIDNPDLAVHTGALGPRYMVHLLPVVLREIDDLKRGGRNQELREAAKRAERRLKGLRTNGDVRTGVKVTAEVYVVFEHIEPKDDNLPSWLDLTVPDDRFVASTLLLQSDHPGSAFYAATSDVNLQTKLSAVGLPFVELP